MLMPLFRSNRLFTLPLIALALSACATPETLKGDFPTITPAQAATSTSAGTRVRWGGTILSLDNTAGGTCFEILARPLNSYGRPLNTDEELGRFLSCYQGFKEPEIYKPGRVVTIVGTLQGTEQRKVGEYEYSYPKVDAETVHLWEEESDRRTYVVDPFFAPYPYYPYPYYYRIYYVPEPQPEPVRPPAVMQQQRSAPLPVPEVRRPLGGVLQRR